MRGSSSWTRNQDSEPKSTPMETFMLASFPKTKSTAKAPSIGSVLATKPKKSYSSITEPGGAGCQMATANIKSPMGIFMWENSKMALNMETESKYTPTGTSTRGSLWMVCRKGMVNIAGTMDPIIRATSNKGVETGTEFGKIQRTQVKCTRGITWSTRSTGTGYTIGEMGTFTRAISWTICDLARDSCCWTVR